MRAKNAIVDYDVLIFKIYSFQNDFETKLTTLKFQKVYF